MREKDVEFFEKKIEACLAEVMAMADYVGTFTPKQKQAITHFVKMGFWNGVNAELSADYIQGLTESGKDATM